MIGIIVLRITLVKLRSWLFCIITGYIFFSSPLFAAGFQFGVTLPILLKSKDPDGVHGYRAVIWYQPKAFIWGKNGRYNLYFAGGVGHWWSHGAKANRSLNIYALAPVFRFYLTKTHYFSPYLEASIGPAYMTRTRFDKQNLGIHYTFQDEVGIGALLGKKQALYASLSALHYSNGRLSSHNSGITIPLILNIGYKFS
jgi:hypothetical protein